MLAAYSGSGAEKQETDKAFGQLFAMSAAGVLFAAILAQVGLYN